MSYQAVRDLLNNHESQWGDVPVTVPETAADLLRLRKAGRNLDTDAFEDWLIEVVTACTPLDENDATRVLALTGMHRSPLVALCLKACGLGGAMDEPEQEAGEPAEVDPTSSPGSQTAE